MTTLRGHAMRAQTRCLVLLSASDSAMLWVRVDKKILKPSDNGHRPRGHA